MKLTYYTFHLILCLVAPATLAMPNDGPFQPKPVAKVVQEAAQDLKKERRRSVRTTLEEIAQTSTLAGSFKPAVKRLLVSSEEANLIWHSIRATAHWEDLIIIMFFGWFTVPTLQFPYDLAPFTKEPFRKSYVFVAAEQIQQIAKIAFAVYVVDIVKMLCIGVGFDFCKMASFPHAFAQSAYSLWAANRLATLKKHFLRNYVSYHPETFGRIQLTNRLMDAAIYGMAVFVILNILQVEMGVAMHSVMAFGSVGTLALGLASQGIMTQILNGLMLASSDRIYEGDQVRFPNGNTGTIVKLGWLETVVRGSDEVMMSIPNTDLVKQQVSNLSRVRYSQVKQVLRFKYKDAGKLPALLTSIKEEIQLTCPELITDGSRPFRAHWTDYGTDYLEVIVDAHFLVKPVGDAYFDNRQRVLQVRGTVLTSHSVGMRVAREASLHLLSYRPSIEQ